MVIKPRGQAEADIVRICRRPGRERGMLRSVSARPASSVKIAPPSPKQPSGLGREEAGRGRKPEGAEAGGP